MKKNGWEWHRSRLLPSYFLPSAPPGYRYVFTLTFPMHISWNNGCTDKNLKCDLLKNLTPFCSAAEAEEEKKTKKKTREGNLRHEFVPLFAELFLGYFLWWCGLFWDEKEKSKEEASYLLTYSYAHTYSQAPSGAYKRGLKAKINCHWREKNKPNSHLSFG